MEEAKARINYARTHSFCDWWRKNDGYWKNKELSDEQVYEHIKELQRRGWKVSVEYYEKRYEMNRNGIDYLCHASSATIKKLESLGLIEIIYDSNGESWGFDRIRVLNY